MNTNIAGSHEYSAGKFIIKSGVIIILMILSFQSIAEDKTDHPLITRFKNATSFDKAVFDYINLEIPTGRIDDAKTTKNILKIEGKGTFISYNLSDKTSQFEFIKNIRQKIKNSGFKILFECETGKEIKNSSCGDDLLHLASTDRTFRGIRSGCGDSYNSYFLSAVLKRSDKRKTYLYICSYKNQIAQSIIEEKEFDFNQLKINSKNYNPNKEALSGLSPQTRKDIEGAGDHPLISRYKGSYITAYDVIDFVRATLPVSPVEQFKNKTKEKFVFTNGKGTFTYYRAQNGVSQYQVVKNYSTALKKSGAEILFQCSNLKQCGPKMSDFSELGEYIDGRLIRHNCGRSDSAYITARIKALNGQNIYLFYCFDRSPWVAISQAIIEEKLMQTNQVSVSADEMKKSIQEKGKVAIYGIYFNTNSEQIKPESESVIKEIAKFLSANPQLKLYVVGHTDSQGEEKYNKLLSLKRGTSVVSILIKKYGIEKNRLQARGVGALVPVSTNQDSEGRKLNRRVELVEM